MSTARYPATIGHNIKPPVAPTPEAIKAYLDAQYADMDSRYRTLVDTAKTVPDKIEDEDTLTKVSELTKAMREFHAAAENTRKIEGTPFGNAKKAVDGWFSIRLDALSEPKAKTGWVQKLQPRMDKFLEAKAEAETRRREAEAQKEREEAAKAAAELEQKRRELEEAEHARKLEEQRAAEAREAAEKARQDEAAAREAETRAKAEAARLDLELRAAKARQEEEAAAAKDRLAELNKQSQEAIDRAAQARRQAAESQQTQQEAEQSAKAASAAARTLSKETGQLNRVADASERRADRLQHAANASAAEKSRTRSELGAVASLATVWQYRVVDYKKIPMSKVWPYLDKAAIDAAIGRMVKGGIRDLKGVVIEQVQSTRVV